MKFAGMVKSSTVDYPGKIVAAVFTGGCNFRCEYCHNPELIEISGDKLTLDGEEVITYLKKRRTLLDGLCITGGEPLLWGDELFSFISEVKSVMGREFLIKLDTNGSLPLMLKKASGIVDFIAMDVKSADYSPFSGIGLKEIKESLEYLINCNDYEVRITAYPKYINTESITALSSILKICKKVVLQNFSPKRIYDPAAAEVKPYGREEIEGFAEILKKSGINVIIR